LLLAAPARAQDVSLWLDGATSHAQPPAGVAGDATLYGLVGARLDATVDWGGATLQGRMGNALTGSEGRWLQGYAGVTTGRVIGRSAIRVAGSAFGLRYLDPFEYRAGGVDLRPSLALPAGGFVLALQPRLTTGSWSADSLDGPLRVTGGDLELRRSVGAVTVGVSATGLDVDNGTMEGTVWGGGGDLSLDLGRWTVTGRVSARRTPLEDELGGGVSVQAFVAPGIEFRAEAARSLRDPLLGTPGSVVFSAGLSLRPFQWWLAPTAPPVAAIGERREGGREVRFALRAPGAEEVALVGDFNGWEPRPMHLEDGRWRLTCILGPGLHHFGFMVDGDWALPPDAPGVVDDGWGRRNASIVVEP
jgi:hypothetical protein